MQMSMSSFAQRPAPFAGTTDRRQKQPVVRTRVASGNAAMHIPKRNFLDDEPEENFRYGKPDYTLVNTEYLKNKKSKWAAGSLEDVVESVVKTFEFEISHKKTADLVRSFAPGFTYSQNGGPKIDGAELLRRGSYNVLINDESYTSNNWDFEESHTQFKTTFSKGFAWEVTEVMVGPPNVTFRWRHWGEMSGPYNNHAATGKTIEMFGMAIARVNEKLQIEALEIYYDPTDFLSGLTSGGKCPMGFGSSSAAPAAVTGSSGGGNPLSGVLGFLGFGKN